MESRLIHLTARVAYDAGKPPEGGTAPAAPRFRGVAYSGGPIPNRNWDGSASLIDMDSFALPAEGRKVFILADHDDECKVGFAMAYKRGGKIVLEDGQFFSNESGQEAALLMSEDAPYEFSVGITGDMLWLDGPARPKVKQDGVEYEIGSTVYNARLLEVSLVTAGADPKTEVQRLSSRFNIQPVETKMATDDKTTPAGENGDNGTTTTPAAPVAVKLSAQEQVTMASLEQRNKDLVNQVTALELSVRALSRDLAEKEAALVTAHAEFAAMRNKSRDTQLDELLGDEVTAADREKYHAMDNETFAMVMGNVKKYRPTTVKRGGHLYAAHDSAKGEAKPGVSLLMASAQSLGLVKQPKGAQ
jgi:hypothetical protein